MKPDNLLISEHPRIKLADFGNVHFLPNDDCTIRGLEGTTSYMSPEMRSGFHYGTKTDIWSLGVTLLNVLFHNDTSSPNFEDAGPWAARRFAEEQMYCSIELEDFVYCLFLKSSDRPTAQQLLEVYFCVNTLTSSILSSRKQTRCYSKLYSIYSLHRISHYPSYRNDSNQKHPHQHQTKNQLSLNPINLVL